MVTVTLFRERRKLQQGFFLRELRFFNQCMTERVLRRIQQSMVSNSTVKHKFIFRLLGLSAGHGIFYGRFWACLYLITLIYLVEQANK